MNLSYRNKFTANILSQLWDKPLDKKDWFKINDESDSGEVEILIYDIIGWPWIEANELVSAMNDLKGRPITFGINSPGGDVVDAVAIYQAMKRHDAKVTVRIDSLAASSASIIAMGGKDVNAYKSSMVMIHNPWLFAIGNEFVMEEARDILREYGGIIQDIYADRASIGKKQIKQLMDGDEKRDGTWMKAKIAKENGFIDNIIEGSGEKTKNDFSLSIFAGVPDEILDNDEPEIRKAEKALRDAGFSRNRAKALLAGCQNGHQRDADKLNDLNSILQSIKA